MRRLLTALALAAALTACSQPAAPVTPSGDWSGDALVDGSYFGAVAADYDTRRWAMCSIYAQCIIGRTSGWDLIDAYGERITGTYHQGRVSLYYRWPTGETLTAEMVRD